MQRCNPSADLGPRPRSERAGECSARFAALFGIGTRR